MDKNKELAIELAKALIQNNNVKPVFRASGAEEIGYLLGEFHYSFTELVFHFHESIRRIEEWEM